MNHTIEEKERAGLTGRLGAFAADKRNFLYLIYIALVILCCFSGERIVLRDNPTDYLPKDAETRRGLTVLESEFADLGTARILLDNVSAPQARELSERLTLISGVQTADFNEMEDYRTGNALLRVTFRAPDGAPETREAMTEIRAALNGYDYALIPDGETSPAFNGEIRLVAAIVCAAVLMALAALAPLPSVIGFCALALTFGAAFLLDTGTHFVFGAISPAALWDAGLLQFSMCAAFLIPFYRRALDARKRLEAREAVLAAWTRSAPELLGGSAVLILSLLTLNALRLRVGVNPGLVLVKSVVITLLTLGLFAPALLVTLCGFLDGARPRKNSAYAETLRNFAINTRLAISALFALLLIAAGICVAYFPRAYDASALPVWFLWGNQQAEGQAEELFGQKKELSILLPTGDAYREAALLDELAAIDGVKSARGLANVETTGGYTLAERLTPRRFAEFMDIDPDEARSLYSAYVQDQSVYGQLAAGLDDSTVPLAEMYLFAYERAREGYVSLDRSRERELELLYKRVEGAVRELKGAEHSRLILNLDVPENSAKTFALLYAVRSAVERYYPEGTLYVGAAALDADFSAAFQRDGLLFTVLTFVIAFIALFLLCGAAPAVLTALVILGGVWMNFALWILSRQNVYFLADLLVCAMQTAFALFLSLTLAGRYLELKRETDTKDALTRTMEEAFPSVLLSGSAVTLISIAAGVLCGNRIAAASALCFGLGAAVSALLTLFVLPQALLLLSPPVAASKRTPRPAKPKAVKAKKEKPKRVRNEKKPKEMKEASAAPTPPVKTDAKPVEAPKPIKTDAKPVETPKPVKTDAKPVEPPKPVKTDAKPVETPKPFKTDAKPVEPPKPVKTDAKPIETPKPVKTDAKPVEAPKPVVTQEEKNFLDEMVKPIERDKTKTIKMSKYKPQPTDEYKAMVSAENRGGLDADKFTPVSEILRDDKGASDASKGADKGAAPDASKDAVKGASDASKTADKSAAETVILAPESGKENEINWKKSAPPEASGATAERQGKEASGHETK